MTQAVTAEDVMRVANTYFPDEGKNILWYFRKEGGVVDPELDALTDQAKAMAKQTIAQINQVTDPAEIQGLLSQFEAAKSQVPAEFLPAIELIISRAQERLLALSEATGEEE